MNTNNIKRYAPKARTAFISAMTKRAALFGIRESSMGIEPLEQKGDLALIGDRPFPASIIRPRAALVKKVEQIGFAQAMEQAAYSWFNRLCAIRYMELKGYLDHGRRVLSHPDQPGSFQILDDCLDIELEGLDKQHIAELKLDGTKDEELYRELLLAQCHALHQAMPFLFEAIDDATELLLPDNLTKTDSLIRELVSAIPDEEWHDVEIIGWLYQFYISEKKAQVIGKVVKSEDIPAATQLFTPNWIVQYLVQNSVGRQWLQTYQASPLKAKMPYYIEPTEQSTEVQNELASITPDSIDPLTIKVLDPACGSGHILVEAYKVLKEIYTERGFRSRDIPQLILENNLFGLDIDDRAGQLAGFALMMLAREDDRRIFGREIKLNLLSLQESSHLDFTNLWKALNLTSDWQRGQSQSLFESEQTDLSSNSADNRYQMLKATLARFIQAKTFGSLIEVPAQDAEPLAELLDQLRQLARVGDSMQKPAAQQLIPYVQQAWVLAQRYDAVVANPPYMGGKGMNETLKNFAEKFYPDSKSDLFAIFMRRAFNLLKAHGNNAQINMHSWMFISSYDDLRKHIIKRNTIISMAHFGSKAFDQISGEKVQTVAWIISNWSIKKYKSKFFDLTSGREAEKKEGLRKGTGLHIVNDQNAFSNIPGSPIQYWTESWALDLYSRFNTLNPRAVKGLDTNGAIERFLRYWHEISIEKFSISGGGKWFPLAKGGTYRKWYGNHDYVINYENEGSALRANKANLRNKDKYGKEGATWTVVSTSGFSVRYMPDGFLFDQGGSGIFCIDNDEHDIECLISSLNSSIGGRLAKDLCPTLNFTTGDVNKILLIAPDGLSELGKRAIAISKEDWDSYEGSWDYNSIISTFRKHNSKKISDTFNFYSEKCERLTTDLSEVEIKINTLINKKIGFEVPLPVKPTQSKITLTCNPSYRGESWAWFGLAKTYENEPEKAICLVSFGLTCAHDPKFSIPGLVRLAELLAQIGAHDYASKALVKLTKIYSNNGWALKDSIVELTSSAWFDASLDTSDLDAHVEELAIGANHYAMAKPTYLSGVLLSVHESGKGATIYIHRDLKFSARKAVFENRKIPKPGTLVKIFCDMGSESQDVVSVENIQVIETQDIRSFKGSLKVSEKGFGFVNGDIFVPPGLVESVQRDAEVAGAAVMSFDKIKGGGKN
ncbi:BREX-1 system adenine-specific DNA-methyltransferase PglX [Pseudomonas helleri]|uniref:BREX-1 system adenine-specific DNA-methyltransferase PglX n=1 Tax=Pseudomonas helleri TaxID=1608996 RepID=UPI003F9CA72E